MIRGRAFSEPIKKIPERKLIVGRYRYPSWEMPERPKTRAVCADGPRPCPWVGCEYHLYLDVNPENGTIKYNYPGIEPEELEDCCALDIAEEMGCTLDEVGSLMNLTRERVRQTESAAFAKLKEESWGIEEE